MPDAKDPREEQQRADVPLEETREDDSFEPITPDGVDKGKPAVPDPKDSQNPPPRPL
ncbi:hypothetical protein [Microbacterium sp. A93]|uniref:hypothetical protein n=1 Tax=unclassified Microbacterium TaxID=2609290 RepID=UPI003F42A0B2